MRLFVAARAGRQRVDVSLCCLLALAPVAMSCGGSDGGTPPPARSISLSASPQAVSLTSGGTGTVTVTVARTGGFDGPVTLAVSGLPVGVTASVTPTQLTPASSQAAIVLTVAAAVTPGPYSATITASASGVATTSATVAITITQPPDYALSVTPGNVLVNAGASGQVTIGIDRTGISSPVSLVLVNPPNGISGSFATTPASGASTLLTVSVASTVTNGTTTLTIAGTADGLSRTTTMTLSVAPAPSFQFSLAPSFVPMGAGTSRNLLAEITRLNFNDAVSLSLRNPPSGITGRFTPSSTTGNHGSFIIDVAATIAPGTYPLTVVGTATGAPETQRTVNVSVTNPGAPPPPSSPDNSFSLAVTTSMVSAPPGGSTSNSVLMNRFSGAGDITLSVESAPPGVTAVFTPAVLSGPTMFSALQIQVAPNVAPGSYQLVVRGSAPGFTTADTFTLGVFTGSAFTLRPTIPSITLLPTWDVFFTISIVRQNFTGPVMLQLEKVPPGMTVALLPVWTTLNAAEFRLFVSQAPTPGTHTLTIRGSSPGQADQTTTIQVIIPDGSFTIDMTPVIDAYPGAIANSTISATRTNWPHDIALRIEDAFGLTTVPSSLSSLVLNGSTPTSTLTMNMPQTEGNQRASVRVTSNGVELIRSVSALVLWRKFIFLTSSQFVSIPAGTSSSVPISAQRLNFDGPYTLTVSGQPAGMTVSFSPNPVTGTASSMTVNVGAGVAPGSYNLTVAAIAAGVKPESRSITVFVP